MAYSKADYKQISVVMNDEEDMYLRPIKVIVKTGDDDEYTNQVVLTQNTKGGMDINYNSKDIEKNWNRPRALDVEVHFEGEHGHNRVLKILFHKGDTYVNWDLEN
jgi:hypothetical protein